MVCGRGSPTFQPTSDQYRRLGLEAQLSLGQADLRPGAAVRHQPSARLGAYDRSGLAHRPAQGGGRERDLGSAYALTATRALPHAIRSLTASLSYNIGATAGASSKPPNVAFHAEGQSPLRARGRPASSGPHSTTLSSALDERSGLGHWVVEIGLLLDQSKSSMRRWRADPQTARDLNAASK